MRVAKHRHCARSACWGLATGLCSNTRGCWSAEPLPIQHCHASVPCCLPHSSWRLPAAWPSAACLPGPWSPETSRAMQTGHLPSLLLLLPRSTAGCCWLESTEEPLGSKACMWPAPHTSIPARSYLTVLLAVWPAAVHLPSHWCPGPAICPRGLAHPCLPRLDLQEPCHLQLLVWQAPCAEFGSHDAPGGFRVVDIHFRAWSVTSAVTC